MVLASTGVGATGAGSGAAASRLFTFNAMMLTNSAARLISDVKIDIQNVRQLALDVSSVWRC